jgi:6-phosphogluconolactonase (cycloisomerase 2 family)
MLIGVQTSYAEEQAGAVYVMTNQVPNAVQVFHRAANGILTPGGAFLTGGSGAPTGNPFGNPNDPLASQNSVVLSRDHHLLFVVNAGSNEISVFAVEKNGLDLRDKVPSGGQLPISLTIHDDLLYVLNGGLTPNITGFHLGPDGKLTPLAGSTRPLSGGAAANPAEVSFTPDGDVLIVTEKNTNLFDTYTVGEDGLASGPASQNSVGIEPFGFDFARQNVLVDSETMQGAPEMGAASSYRISDSGGLDVVSPSVRDFQTAPCWVVITRNHRFAFTTNTASGSVSSYRVASDGALTLLSSLAAAPGPVSFPIDMALSSESRYLYLIANGIHKVFGYRVEPNGSLVLVTTAGGLPPASQGIAAR